MDKRIIPRNVIVIEESVQQFNETVQKHLGQGYKVVDGYSFQIGEKIMYYGRCVKNE